MSLTKDQLKDQLQSYEEQVKSLQNELTERSFQLEEIDGLAAEYEEEIVDLAEDIGDFDALEAQVRDLADMASGLASQLAWTVSMVQSMALYQPNGAATDSPLQQLAESLLEASEPFWTGFTQGLYEPQQLLAQYEVTDVIPTDLDIGEIFATLLSVPETEQEIPDEEPDYYDEDGDAVFVGEDDNSEDAE